MFSTADWDSPFWTNKQHMAVHMADRGFRVLYVESLGLRRPSASARDIGRIGRRLLRGLGVARRVRDRVRVFSPIVLPFHGSRVCRWINDSLLLAGLRLLMGALGFRRPIVWTYNPLLNHVATRLPRAMLVYHCVDNLAAAPGLPADTIVAQEASMLAAADVVFTTSLDLQQRCSRRAPGRTHYFPNVADYNHFSAARRPGPIPDDLQAIPAPRIGFVGAVSGYKLDLDLIARVAEERPDWHWVMIGQIGEGQPDTDIGLLRRPNIHLLGPRDYKALPDYLRGFDVAVLPCAMNAYTRSMFPMKFFEYLSAGRPVVTTPLDALRDYRAACYVAGSAEEFAGAIARVLEGRVPDEALCLRLALRHTWEWRLTEMLRVLEGIAANG